MTYCTKSLKLNSVFDFTVTGIVFFSTSENLTVFKTAPVDVSTKAIRQTQAHAVWLQVSVYTDDLQTSIKKLSKLGQL